MKKFLFLLIPVGIAFGQNSGSRELSCPTVSSGSATAYACNIAVAPSAYKDGYMYKFKADVANSGACTANFNGLGAKSIKVMAGAITSDPVANDIRAGQWVVLIYQATNDTFQMMSQKGNSSAGGTSGGFTTQIVNAQVGSSATNYTGLGGGALNASASIRAMEVPAGTLTNLSVLTTGAQPAACTMTITVCTWNGTSCTDGNLTVSIAGGAAAGTFRDTTHSMTVNDADKIAYKLANGACTSANVLSLGIKGVF